MGDPLYKYKTVSRLAGQMRAFVFPSVSQQSTYESDINVWAEETLSFFFKLLFKTN